MSADQADLLIKVIANLETQITLVGVALVFAIVGSRFIK